MPFRTSLESMLDRVGDKLAQNDANCRHIARLQIKRREIGRKFDLAILTDSGSDIVDDGSEKIVDAGRFHILAQTQAPMRCRYRLDAIASGCESRASILAARLPHLKAKQG